MIKNTYRIGQRCMAYILLVSLLLQSCSGAAISTKPVDIAIEPTTLIELPQQILEHPVEGIAGVDQPISDALVHTAAAGLAITQSSFKGKNIQLKQLALEPGEQVEKTTSSITTGSILVKKANAIPTKTVQQANHSKGKDPKRGLQARLVIQQKALQSNQAINRQERNKPLEHELPSQVFQTKPGQQVSFYQEAGVWKAKVEEKFGNLKGCMII